ncbi:MAG: hypothetical protein NXI10_05130 [bacterium]|nr:hypothetical protein [bacterium]
MKRFLPILKNPLFWFSLFLAFVTVDNNLLDGEFKNVIRSDGRGYYAYLPALFMYNDPTFEASLEAETRNAQPNFNQYYLYQNREGRVFNKYFPGIAVLQSPFFGAGCIAAVISGAPVDGYSEPFELAFLLGSLFYTLLGVWLFHRCIQLRFPWLKDQSQWLVMAIYLCSTLLVYNTFSLGLSHHYSFFLFSLFAYAILKYRDWLHWKYVLIAGLTLGLIALVRPTNILILLAVPLLFKGYAEFKDTVSRLFERKARLFLIAIGGFLVVFSLQFFLWKWQSGHWINWSYSGEGFNFLQPAFLENLFSFRNGLFLHTPIMLVSAVASFWLLRKNTFLFFSWWVYFLVNTWVISSWWCWDYETSFGNRPFTEHTFMLLIPLLYVGQFRTRFLWYSLCIFFLMGWIRHQNYSSGAMIDQRFTASSYFASLAFWQEENHDRWRYPHSVVPFGEKVHEEILSWETKTIRVDKTDEFIHEVNYETPRNRTNERLYFRVWMDKKSKKPLQNVSLVIHATDKDSDFTHYHAIPLFNDRLEGVNEWAPISFSGQIPDHFNDFEKVKIYIWNQGKETFELRNIRIFIDTYKS